MANTLSAFQLYIFSATPFEQPSLTLYESAYRLWHSVWAQTLKELEGLNTLYSDAFTRNDFVVAITHRSEVMALCCFKKMDLRLIATLDDSWFTPWPRNFLMQLSKSYSNALIPSWLSIHQDYRRTSGFTQFNFGLILSELIALLTLQTQSDISFGTPRKDRSVHTWIQKAGGQTIFENVLHHGVPVNLVCFFSQDLKEHKFSDETQHLWARRQSYIADLKPSPKPKETYENSI